MPTPLIVSYLSFLCNKINFISAFINKCRKCSGTILVCCNSTDGIIISTSVNTLKCIIIITICCSIMCQLFITCAAFFTLILIWITCRLYSDRLCIYRSSSCDSKSLVVIQCHYCRIRYFLAINIINTYSRLCSIFCCLSHIIPSQYITFCIIQCC